MPVTFGKVSVGGRRGGGATIPIDFTDEEGKKKRRKMVAHYGKVSMVQLPLAVLAVLSGATTVGLAIPNPHFPFISFFPLVNSALVLGASLCTRRIGGANLDNEVPRYVKVCFIVSYVLCIVSMTFSGLAAAFSGVGLSYCFHDDAKFRDKCLPVRDVKIGFAIADIVLAVLLLPVSITCLVLFCLHARSLGFANRRQRLENQVAVLQAQVAVLSQNQGQPVPGGGVGGGYSAGGAVNPPYGQTPGYGYAASNPGGGSGGFQGYGGSPAGYTYSTQTTEPNQY